MSFICLSFSQTISNGPCLKLRDPYSMFRNARKKMSPESGDEPPIEKNRFLGKKSQVVEDEKVDGEYGLVINGHSLVREI